MAFHRSFILALAALPLLGGDAAAQETRYRAWDRNNDGVITRAEWRGSLQEFRQLDWNRDGILTRSELGDFGYEDDQDQFDTRTFATLDRNRNGMISRGEWRGDVATFRRVDRNRDNQITRGEFLNANVGNEEEVLYDEYGDFEALDTDNDGRIDRYEWDGTRAAFNQLDYNRDGLITRTEFRRGNSGQQDEVSGTVVVRGRDPWTDTGAIVNAGDLITVRAEGTIQLSNNGDDRANASGAFSGRNAVSSQRPDRPAGALLIRVGNGPVQYIGANGTYRAPTSGRVSLGINDDHFADNVGEYRVFISVSR